MGEDDSGTSNLIVFPSKPAANAGADSAASAASRERDMVRRLETIARTIGVPVATFLNTAQVRNVAQPEVVESKAQGQSETAELVHLFGSITDGETRHQYLSLLRTLAANERV